VLMPEEVLGSLNWPRAFKGLGKYYYL